MKKVIKLGASWCGPCHVLEPVFNKISKMDAFNGIEFKSLDIEYDEGNEMADKYKVRNVPTIIMLDENNNEIKKVVGALPENQLVQILTECMNG